MSRPPISPQGNEIDFEEWICDIIDPVIKDIDSLILNDLTDDQMVIKACWASFAQNTINLIRIMSYLPNHFPQMMMTFRLLQETSADIYYLKNHKENIKILVKAEDEVKKMHTSLRFTLRQMSQVIESTKISNGSGDGTQKRIDAASRFLEDSLGGKLSEDLKDINYLLNGYSHFNPAGVFLQNNLTDNGYFEVYMKVMAFYPAWLYLVLVSLSDLLEIEELDHVKSEKIINDLFTKIQESDRWLVEFTPKS